MTRDTGFPPDVEELIRARAGGVCEAAIGPSCLNKVHQLHHRRPRGMGGTRRASTNLASNGLAVCWPCHGHIETNREEARECGWLVSQAMEPAEVHVRRRGRGVLLDNHGGVVEQKPLW